MTGSHGWCITSPKQMKQIHLGVMVLEFVLWQLIQSALELPEHQQNVTVIAPLLSHPPEAPRQYPAGTAARGEVPSTFSQHTHGRVTSQSLCLKRNYQINIKGKKKQPHCNTVITFLFRTKTVVVENAGISCGCMV